MTLECLEADLGLQVYTIPPVSLGWLRLSFTTNYICVTTVGALIVMLVCVRVVGARLLCACHPHLNVFWFGEQVEIACVYL